MTRLIYPGRIIKPEEFSSANMPELSSGHFGWVGHHLTVLIDTHDGRGAATFRLETNDGDVLAEEPCIFDPESEADRKCMQILSRMDFQHEVPEQKKSAAAFLKEGSDLYYLQIFVPKLNFVARSIQANDAGVKEKSRHATSRYLQVCTRALVEACPKTSYCIAPETRPTTTPRTRRRGITRIPSQPEMKF